MFGSGKSNCTEADVKESDDEKNQRDEIRVGEDGKEVHLGNAGVTETSRATSAFVNRAGSTTRQKWCYRRGWRQLKKYTTG